MRLKTYQLICFFLFCSMILKAQEEVDILSYSTNFFGQVELEINAEADKYYVITALHEPTQSYESITSMTLGIDGPLILREPLAAYPLENYKVISYDINEPDDLDTDEIDDITEYNDMPSYAPLNAAIYFDIEDGQAAITDQETFSELAVVSENIPWAPFLNDQQFVKFAIINQDQEDAEVYFINSKTHAIHASFLSIMGVDNYASNVTTGEIIYSPNAIAPNGLSGVYLFNYSFGNAYSFEYTQRTFELLARNMPFLRNNLQHFIGAGGENIFNTTYKDDYEGSRIDVVLESEFFEDVNFLPFHQAEGFGLLRLMTLDENPGSRDIVIYEVLPNSLPRVGGIITSVVQTPLSHVNLRAIQDNIPNAYIKDPLEDPLISSLLGKYVYYKVSSNEYEIREASLDEVNAWYENLRPTEDQIPERDLSQTEILPLTEIDFNMSDAFGAKCSNVATMGSFGFPEGTIPSGFGVPFYFYDEFMKYNDFYNVAEAMIAEPQFKNDLEYRIDKLKDFRKQIKDADMPQWMLDELEAMHNTWPEGQSIRCRSSTNNEDLPGFSGAGLYTSKTQHPEEGHIKKSIKQVYASMWNFRAYEEREFYRVDHFVAAMGVLCHPNYNDEKSNGVGVSLDPIYYSEDNYYLNTQVGESLITNPDANSIPEEILLDVDPAAGYFVLRYSNLVDEGELVMDVEYLNQLRDYMIKIHEEFEILYNVPGAEGFGMDIEYKVTAEDQLIIKQARPWVSFWADIKAERDLAVLEVINPISSSDLSDQEIVSVRVGNEGLENMTDFELELFVDGDLKETLIVPEEITPQISKTFEFSVPQDFSDIGDYEIMTVVRQNEDGYSKNDTLRQKVSKLHVLEGGLEIIAVYDKCSSSIEVVAQLTNYGSNTFENATIDILLNGEDAGTYLYEQEVKYGESREFSIEIFDDLLTGEHIIDLSLVAMNGEIDAIPTNNTASISTNESPTFDFVTLVINADDYPAETSWALYNEDENTWVESGNLGPSVDQYVKDICIDYDACYSIHLYDSYGDGICCSFGQGDFLMIDAMGDTLLTNNGEFLSETQEVFCMSCKIEATLTLSPATGESIADGTLFIIPSGGIGPYEYSIDGGETFGTSAYIDGLEPGSYELVIRDVTGNCFYTEVVEIGFEIPTLVIEQSIGTFKIFPNPTSDLLHIRLAENHVFTKDINIMLFSSHGRLIQETNLELTQGNIELNVVNLPSGTYVVRCSSEEIESYYRVVKM